MIDSGGLSFDKRARLLMPLPVAVAASPGVCSGASAKFSHYPLSLSDSADGSGAERYMSFDSRDGGSSTNFESNGSSGGITNFESNGSSGGSCGSSGEWPSASSGCGSSCTSSFGSRTSGCYSSSPGQSITSLTSGTTTLSETMENQPQPTVLRQVDFNFIRDLDVRGASFTVTDPRFAPLRPSFFLLLVVHRFLGASGGSVAVIYLKHRHNVSPVSVLWAGLDV